MSPKWNRPLILCCLMFALQSALSPTIVASEVDRLISISKSRNCVRTGQAPGKVRFTDQELTQAVQYVEKHRDFTSYHVLMSLYEYHSGVYSKIDADTRAAVFASAMVNLPMNDWGTLDPHGSRNFDAAEVYLNLGSHALRQLVPILDNESPAPCFGSEIATDSHVWKYRRCDYAYRYAMMLLGEKPTFHVDMAARDVDITALKRRLKELGVKAPEQPAKWVEEPARDSSLAPKPISEPRDVEHQKSG